MKEFTFNCATCGQPILASTDWEGRSMNCPSCNTRLIITAAAKPKPRTRLGSQTKARAKLASNSKRPPGFR